MSSLFGSSSAASTPAVPSAGLRVQTSIEGVARAIGWGQTRAAGNLIWYGGFVAFPAASGQQGGKGGIFSSPSSTSSYNYFASVEVALGEGVISGVGQIWADQSLTTLAIVGLGVFDGTASQLPWSYLTATYPGQDFAYRNTAYVAGTVFLGSSPSLPNWTFEIQFSVNELATFGVTDAEPTAMTRDFLTNANYGVAGWQSSYNGDWSQARAYALASGLLVSYALTDATTGASFLQNFFTSLNIDPVWSNAVLNLVPRGDETIVAGTITAATVTATIPSESPQGNYPIQVATPASFVADKGVVDSVTLIPYTSVVVPWYEVLSSGQYEVSATGLYAFSPADVGRSVDISFTEAAMASYNPPAAPLFDLNDSDFLSNQSGFGNTNADPVSGQRLPPRLQNNIVKVEYLDRSNSYNPAVTQAQDDGAILLYGERGSDSTNSWHWFQTLSAAGQAADLALGRARIANNYSFTLRPRYVVLDPGDIVSITDMGTATDPGLGLNRQWVRILDVQENNDRSINFLVEEYLEGTGAAPVYGREVSAGSAQNYQADPGGINAPLIFEPTDELAGGLQVWAAISGVNVALFGGSDAYASYDGINYSLVPNGRQFGSARMGVLTAPLPAVAINLTGQTIDAINTLAVDLTESSGELASGSQTDALALNTACYVDGEIISYQTATLTAADKYNLTYLVRGVYGTEASIVTHAAGASFARLDAGILKIPFDQTRIGTTLYLKFLPFNIWGITVATLADVPQYTYTITGSALASPLPNIANARTVFSSGFQNIWWDEVTDFRSGIMYRVKKGTTPQGAQVLAIQAHPPFVAFGDGTYWIEAFCQPVAALLVYSETPTSITIAGSMLTQNVVETLNFQTLGWTGTFSDVAKEGVNPSAVLRLDSVGNILTEANVLADPDIFNSAGISLTGVWTSDIVIDAGYVADCSINVSWLSTGEPVGQNILTIADFLNAPDILGAASAAFVSVWVEVRTATTTTLGVPNWSSWQKFVPGVYRCEYTQFRVPFSSQSSAVIAYLLAMTAQISVPGRIDNYLGNNVTTSGLTIIFEPDDASTPKPFNGGPLVGGTNNHPLPSVSMAWPGNPTANYIIDSISLSQMTFHFVNSVGATVEVDSVNIYVEGF